MAPPELWPMVLVARVPDVTMELGGGLDGPPDLLPVMQQKEGTSKYLSTNLKNFNFRYITI